tara:strand:+ start:238 stop:420 length:183 start_codon:yes stop_codon:yes gene_type:complete
MLVFDGAGLDVAANGLNDVACTLGLFWIVSKLKDKEGYSIPSTILFLTGRTREGGVENID